MPNPIIKKPLVDPSVEMPLVCMTILTGKRPDVLRRSLESYKEHGLLDAVHVALAYNFAGDEETYAVLDEFCIGSDDESECGLKNGPATSALMSRFLKTDCQVLLHVEDDFILDSDLHQAYPEWFQTAAGLAMNPDVGQVRLRDIEHLGALVNVQQDPKQKPLFAGDGSAASNLHFVSNKLVVWETEPEWPFMVSSESPMTSPAHWTNNASMVNRSLVEQVFWSPVVDEYHAMARAYAARTHNGRLFATAQMRPGAFRHDDTAPSLEGHRW